MTSEQIRGKYWTLFNRLAERPRTMNSDMQMFVAEMVGECAAQMAELNEKYAAGVGLVNFEKLCLDISRLVELLEKKE